MRLRNKKTGKVLRVGEDVYIRSLDSGSIEVREDFGCGNKIEYFKTFAKMFERYEEIKEPLIKDEKIRKAVRAWAEAECFEEVAVMCHLVWGEKMTEIANISNARQDIAFKGNLGIKMGNYTIEELCGEEK